MYHPVNVLRAFSQGQESWHHTGVVGTLKGSLKASTEVLLSKNMPKVLMLDASQNADKLCLSIHEMWVPEEMLRKALLNIQEAAKCVKVAWARRGAVAGRGGGLGRRERGREAASNRMRVWRSRRS